MGYVLALWGEFVKFTGGRAGLVHLLLFAAALVCCFFLGKEERHRLFWPSVLVGIFFFNPVFYKYVGTRFLSGVYWRLLWMLPWTFVIAYAVVRMAYRLGKQALRIVVVAVACVCIFVTGKPVLSAETYGERSNVYELPQAAVEIADLVQSRLVDCRRRLSCRTSFYAVSDNIPQPHVCCTEEMRRALSPTSGRKNSRSTRK